MLRGQIETFVSRKNNQVVLIQPSDHRIFMRLQPSDQYGWLGCLEQRIYLAELRFGGNAKDTRATSASTAYVPELFKLCQRKRPTYGVGSYDRSGLCVEDRDEGGAQHARSGARVGDGQSRQLKDSSQKSGASPCESLKKSDDGADNPQTSAGRDPQDRVFPNKCPNGYDVGVAGGEVPIQKTRMHDCVSLRLLRQAHSYACNA